MAAKKARSKMQGDAANRQGAQRRRTGSRGRRSAQTSRSQISSSADMARGNVEGRGMLSDARNMAQSVGDRTVQTARGIASGARDAGAAVANRTQETAAQVVEKVRDNRWPALLIGAGATWLAVDAIRGRGEEHGSRNEGRRRSSARSQRNSAGDTMSSIANAGRELGGRVGRFVRDNPVLAGATTLGVGLAVGMALPQTEAENAVLGDARQRMMRKAKDAARDTVKNVRDVADSVQRMTGRGGEGR